MDKVISTSIFVCATSGCSGETARMLQFVFAFAARICDNIESILIEKAVLRITVWHYEACRVMTNGDPEGWIFRYHPHTINGLFFMSIIKHRIDLEKKRLQEVPKYIEMRNDMMRVREFQYNQCTVLR